MTELLTTPAAMRAWSRRARRDEATVALVPTMGALHAGHESLIGLALRGAERCVASVFVNPLQFDRPADFDAYPRPIDHDIERCERLGVHAVYAPTAATMYPPGFETHVVPGSLAGTMEGAMRPGHFTGVTTVVMKLFDAAQPDIAVFGEKDYQQLAIIMRMTDDLDLGVEIVAGPTVREPDGLAISSRNQRLDVAQRRAAVCVPKALGAAVEAVAAGARAAHAVAATARAVVDAEPAARLEYVTVFEPRTLQPLDEVAPGARIAIAVSFGEVRLIDNRALDS